MSSAARTTNEDFRHLYDKQPVWKEVLTFSFVSGDTAEQKITVPVNGLLQKIIAKCSGASGASVTATVAIDDSSDNEIFSVATLAESTTYPYNVSEPLHGNIVIGVTPSTNPLSDYSVTIYLRGV